MIPTPYTNLNQLLHQMKNHLQSNLGENFQGFYLQGSFAIGDFDQHSDVDFIVILDRELSIEEIGRLQNMHAQLYQEPIPWAQHLEGSYIPCHIMQQAPEPQDEFWFLDNGSSELLLSNHCNTQVVRWSLRKKGITLAGPDPKTFLPAIAIEALKNEIKATINDWGAEILQDPQRFNNRFYQGFILLSFCRMLHALEFGVIASKKVCAQWAKEALDPSWSDLIDRAWATRPNPEVSVRQTADAHDFALTLQFVEMCIIPIVPNRFAPYNLGSSNLRGFL